MRKSARGWRVNDAMNFKRTLMLAALVAVSACGVDKIQHIADLPFDSGHATHDAGSDAGDIEGGSMDSGTVDSGTVDSGTVDSGTVDSGTVDSGTVDSGTPVDSGTVDSGTPDAGCTQNGVSPELAALSGGPYQNCQGGQIPRTDYQQDTRAFSGCCGTLVRVCQVTGFSPQNALYCQ